jgi:hypothetical protein
VWLPAGSAAARFVIRHPNGSEIRSIAPATESNWVNLGEFNLRAGASVEIEVRHADGKETQPLIVDALRCTRLDDDD